MGGGRWQARLISSNRARTCSRLTMEFGVLHMRRETFTREILTLFIAACSGALPVHAQQTTSAAAPVEMTVTVRLLGENKRMPEIKREDVFVRQGEKRRQVTGWTPALGNRAGLELLILMDDALEPAVGIHLDELRAFINKQPASTAVGAGYMRNGMVQIVQTFTADHSLAAKALRLPLATSAATSPYLSLIDMIKRWPNSSNRHEVLMITDGIDRFRDEVNRFGFINPDVDSAIDDAQRSGIIVHAIFARGIGRQGRNFWAITNGQNGMGKLADDTGGEFYYSGTQNPVSFEPYLADLQVTLDNQYLLEFEAIPGKTSELQPVHLSTEVAGVELNAANRVRVKAK